MIKHFLSKKTEREKTKSSIKVKEEEEKKEFDCRHSHSILI
jgi:hypothetical protein